MRLYLVASKPTDSVIFGFIPAAAQLGLEVVLLTDQPEAHERALADSRHRPRPGCPPPGSVSGGAGTARAAAGAAHAGTGAGRHQASAAPDRIVACDVWDARELIGLIATLPAADAIFSNSDHLQAQTALAAEYFGVPGKDWRSAMRAKNKALMRRRLAETGTEHVAAAEIRPGTRRPLPHLTYPVVLKPSDGVASEDVMLVRDPGELAECCARIFARRPGATLLAEEYLPGELRTIETLGDGRTRWVLGGFRTQLCPPPFFIEERLTWDAGVRDTWDAGVRDTGVPDTGGPDTGVRHALSALDSLGTSFGACHTEYVLDGERGPALIEVNDRLIGDHCDFVMGDLLDIDLFELVLRVHLGWRLPSGPPPKPRPGQGYAVLDYVVADRPGMLASAPPPGPWPASEPGVLLSCWPLREAGERVQLTNTNRDYLGVISAIGPDPAAVAASVAAVRDAGAWKITREPPR